MRNVGKPFVEVALAPVGGEAVFVQVLVGEAHLAHRLRRRRVGVEGEEVERPAVVARRREELVRALDEVFHARRGVGGRDVVGADAGVEPTVAVSADLEMREARLEVRRRDAVEAHVFGERRPEHGVLLHVGMVLRLVPDLPVADSRLHAAGPALVVVRHDALADARPLGEVRRRPRVHARVAALDEVLDRHAQPEIRLDAICQKRLYQRVGVGEAVAGGIRFVGAEVGEEIGDVGVEAAAEPAADVVKARKRDAGLLEVVEQRPVIERADHWRLAHAIHRLDGADGPVGENRYLHFESL